MGKWVVYKWLTDDTRPAPRGTTSKSLSPFCHKEGFPGVTDHSHFGTSTSYNVLHRSRYSLPTVHNPVSSVCLLPPSLEHRRADPHTHPLPRSVSPWYSFSCLYVVTWYSVPLDNITFLVLFPRPHRSGYRWVYDTTPWTWNRTSGTPSWLQSTPSHSGFSPHGTFEPDPGVWSRYSTDIFLEGQGSPSFRSQVCMLTHFLWRSGSIFCRKVSTFGSIKLETESPKTKSLCLRCFKRPKKIDT